MWWLGSAYSWWKIMNAQVSWYKLYIIWRTCSFFVVVYVKPSAKCDICERSRFCPRCSSDVFQYTTQRHISQRKFMTRNFVESFIISGQLFCQFSILQRQIGSFASTEHLPPGWERKSKSIWRVVCIIKGMCYRIRGVSGCLTLVNVPCLFSRLFEARAMFSSPSNLRIWIVRERKKLWKKRSQSYLREWNFLFF